MDNCAFCLKPIESFHLTKEIYKRKVHAVCLKYVDELVKQWFIE